MNELQVEQRGGFKAFLRMEADVFTEILT